MSWISTLFLQPAALCWRISIISIVLCTVWTSSFAQKTSQNVALTGLMGSKALLVINGAPPKLFEAGQLHAGVKLVNTANDSALLEISGKRVTLRVGEAPVSVGSNGSASGGSANGSKITLPMSSGGHFMANGSINGGAIQFMVDTGATSIALGASDAQRLGIDYQKGTPVRMSTANGVAQGWRVVLNSVRVGDVEVFGVEAVVGPNMPFALLGNSFLNRFSMNKNADVMVLERRF